MLASTDNLMKYDAAAPRINWLAYLGNDDDRFEDIAGEEIS